ncbi:Ig-like domain-containing protein [Fibrella arboris]|uniref:Ig-like domain-containing protein n=1 Tax=Fibrella arboris TaxID=3242486 RepID=UPI003522E792
MQKFSFLKLHLTHLLPALRNDFKECCDKMDAFVRLPDSPAFSWFRLVCGLLVAMGATAGVAGLHVADDLLLTDPNSHTAISTQANAKSPTADGTDKKIGKQTLPTSGPSAGGGASAKAAALVDPGCIGTTNLKLWLKADASVTTSGTVVTDWADAAAPANIVSQATAANQPAYQATGLNFNPGISFDGTNDFLGNTTYPNTNVFSGQNNYTLFSVIIPTSVSGSRVAVSFTANQYLAVTSPGSTYLVGEIVSHIASPASISVTVPAIQTVMKSSTLAGGMTVFTNGAANVFNNTTSDPNYTATRTGLGIGSASNTASASPFSGIISEVIAYSSSLTTGQREIVESYLGLKYGLALNHNYVASDGSVIYNPSSYSANITGIGRDDCSSLDQRQSKSANSKALVTIGLGNIATSNQTNANTFSADKSFVVFGDDDDNAGFFSKAGAPSSRRILGRTWRVTETGTVGSVKIQVPDNSSSQTTKLPEESNTVYLLVDADGNFSSGATEIPMTLNGTNWEADVNFTNGQYFTIATQRSAGLAPNTYNYAANNWVTMRGNGTATWLQFDPANPTASPAIKCLSYNAPSNDNTIFYGAAATYSDPTNGDLELFLTPNTVNVNNTSPLISVRNPDGTTLTNGNSLSHAYGRTQGPLFVPVPGDPNRVYLFHSSNGFTFGATPTIQSGAILYSVINLATRTVETKNQVFITSTNTTAALAGTPHSDGVSIWVAVNAGNQFIVKRITGINTSGATPVIVADAQVATTLPLTSVSSDDYATTGITFSAEGNRVAIATSDNSISNGQNSLVYDFNRTTGQLSRLNAPFDANGGASGFPLIFTKSSNRVYYGYQSKLFFYRINRYNGVCNVIDTFLGQDIPCLDPAGNSLYTAGSPVITGNINNIYRFDNLDAALPTVTSLPVPLTSCTSTNHHIGTNSLTGPRPIIYPGQFTFGNAALATTTGSFTASTDLDQQGTITLPVTGVTAGEVAITLSGTGFKTNHAPVSLTAGQTSLTIPITYDGSDIGSTVTLTLASAQGSGTCSVTIPIQKVAVSPGHVTASDLQLWLKADANLSVSGTAVTAWADATNLTNIVSQTNAANQPTYLSSGLNFNPGIRFNGSTNFLSNKTYGAEKVFCGTCNFAVVAVSVPTAVTSTAYMVSFSTLQSLRKASGYSILTAESASHQTSALNDQSANVPVIQTMVKSSTAAGGVTYFNNGTNKALINSTPDPDYTGLGGFPGLAIGSISTTAATQPYDGIITEVIAFSNSLATGQVQSLETYLGIKYGLTLGHNYLSSSGTTVYDVSSYSANITGIGRDDASGLNQKQSKSVSTSALVTMGNGNTIAADNALNANGFAADQSFLLFGDNTGSISSFGTTGAPANRKILARTWKVAETGTVGSVKLQVPDNGSSQTTKLPTELGTVYLLVDADGNFSSGATEIPMTLNGTDWEANVNLNNGQFFTFATETTLSLTVVSPANNSQVNLNTTISGSATAGSLVTIVGPSNATLCTTTAVSGQFSCPVALSTGQQTLTVSAALSGSTVSQPLTLTAVGSSPALTVNPSPDTQTVASGSPFSGGASVAISANPQGGTQPLTYSAFNLVSGSATAGTGPLATPHGTVSIDPTTGIYSYTPTAAYSGTDAIGIKVCDASTPTAQCASTIIPINITSGTVSPAQGPGSVSANLQVWLKADAGTSSTANGAALTGWNDQSGNARHHTQPTAGSQPKFRTNAFNFNPAVSFDGADVLVTDAFASGKEAVHVFAMARVGDSGWRAMYGFGRDATHVQWLSTLPSVWTSGNYYTSTALGIDYGVTSYILPKDGSQRTIHWNGASSNIAGTNAYSYNTNKMGVGSDVTSDGLFLSENFLGDIAEVVIYKTGTPTSNGGRMATPDIDRIESYLGLKYGTTLSHNYLSSTGATIYSVASYSANITGIGRDDASGLNQKQSKSIDARGLVTIGNGTGIAATNALNSNAFAADNSFDIVGDNAQSATFGLSYAPTTFTPAVVGAFYRMARTWKVQETGTVGTITVSVPVSSRAERLLVSSDGTFTPGATQEILLTADGNGNLTAQVDLTNGQFFSFGAVVIAPGGVSSNLQTWLKADAGTSSTTNGAALTGWDDQSVNNRNHTQTTAAYQPKFKTNGFNFNPAVSFDGSDVLITDAFASGQEAVHAFAMARVGDSGWRAIYGFGRDATHVQWLSTLPSVWLSGNYYSSSALGLDYGVTSYILPKDGSQKTIHWNGASSNIAGTNAYSYNTNKMGVGSDVTSDGLFLSENFLGDIAEVVIYKTGTPTSNGGRMATPDIDRIESYLGLKYGTTLSHNYVASDGTTIYNVASYSANIAGIGRDDAQGLYQKQSKSINTRLIQPTVGNGSTLTSANTLNNGVFTANKSFLIWGDNAQPRSYSAAYVPTSFTPAGGVGFYRMAATWKVQETGTVGTVVVGIPSSSGADYLLVSNTASFLPASTQEVALTSDGNGNLVASVDLTNGQFFTFGAPQRVPGGVSNNLTIWLKADAGVTTSGTLVSQWDNQVLLNPYSLVQATAANRPEYITSGSGLVNYNPSIYYQGSKVLYNANSFMPGTSPYTFMMAAQDESDDLGVGTLLSTADVFDYFEFNKLNTGTTSNGWNPYGVGGSPDLGPFGKGNKFSPAGGVNGWYNGTGYTRNALTQHVQPQLLGFASANSIASFGTSMATWTDGYKDTPSWSYIDESAGLAAIVQPHFFKELSVGADRGSAGTEPWEGPINEVIIYGSNLNDNEAQRVNTYLAIKNGVTLGQGNGIVNRNGSNVDYLATNSTVVWSATANSAYNYDIAGIGLDNVEGLNQKQSRSVNAGFQPAIGLGTVELSNETNSGVFATDKSYAVWGSNGLASDYALSYTPHSFTVAAPVYLMSRIWKVQETGTVGTVTVSVPGSATGTYLLVGSSASSFSAGTATEYAMTPDGTGNLVAQVDLANGQYFTFGRASFAPGCVTPNLTVWLKADAITNLASGSAVQTWVDYSPNGLNHTKVSLANSQPTFTENVFNYNPAVTFDGSDVLMTDAFASGTDAVHVFAMTRVNDNNWRAFYGFNRDRTHVQWYNNLAANRPSVWTAGSGNDITSTNLGVLSGVTAHLLPKDGTAQTIKWNGTAGTINASPITTYDFSTNKMGVGGDAANDGSSLSEMFLGDIAEVVVYKTANGAAMNAIDVNKIESYLALKYGVTLSHNYLSGAGTTIYNVASYSANVTGVGRDDCQQLLQKQSKSMNGGAKMTISISNTVAASNTTNPGSFTVDQSFIAFGDNGLTGTSALSAAAATGCPPPPLADRYTNLAYKVTETGTAPAAFLQVDVSTFGFNATYPIYMQVFSDAGFTTLLASVPMSYTNGTATSLFDFPANSTSYVRFVGNTIAPANACVAPKPQTFHWNGWWYGTKQKVLLPNYIPQSQSATAAMTMSVTVSDGGNNNLLYKPAVDWWPVFDGHGLFIPRNDNNSASGLLSQNNTITTRMQFRQGTSTSVVSANTVNFMVYDVDGWYWSRDLVKIYGKQGANTISPKLTQFKPTVAWDPLQLNYQGNPQQAIGGYWPWDLSAWGRVYVNFDQPVEEVIVEYRKDNRFNFNVYNDMRIGPVTTTCLPPVPKAPLVDNIYVYKEVSPNPQKTDENVTYKFTVQNTNCATKTINLTDNLPGGLLWVDSTFVYSTSLTVGSVNAYGGAPNLSLSNVSVPPGTHYFFVDAVGSTQGNYNNQASYVVTNGTGATYLSDDPSVAGTAAQPTPLTLIANDPDAQLTVSKTVDKATTAQNTVVTYNFTVSSTNAVSAVQTTFQDILPGELTFVGGSLSGLSGAYTSSTAVAAYAGGSALTLRDLIVPANGSVTFSIQANVNSYTVGAAASNIATATPDVNSGFRIKAVNSNVVSTTIMNPPTVTILSPANSTTTALNTTVSGTATPGASVTLTSSNGGQLCTTTATAGGTWSCPVALTAGPQTLSAVASNNAGTSSPATAQITVVNTVAPLTAGTPPALTATSGGTQTGNAASDLLPSGGMTPYTYSNDTGNSSCSAVSGATQLPPSNLTVASGTGSYSYTAPTTPGTYYFCIKVCDSSMPTPQCVTKTYTLVVTAAPASGTINCTATQIIGAINQGTAGSGVLKLTIDVTNTGTLPVPVSGSGMSLQINPTNLVATATGVQTFYVPVNYDGSTLGTLTVTVTGVGTCTYNLAGQTPSGKNQPVMDIGGSCVAITPATLGK